MEEIRIIFPILVLILIVSYIILRRADNKIPLFVIQDHNEGNNSEPISPILLQKILHKHIAFFAYVASAIICFIIGILAIINIIDIGISVSHLKDILTFTGGAIATGAFWRLYLKCSKEVNLHLRKK